MSAQFAIIPLILIALMVLLVVGGLVGLIAYRPTRAAGVAIAAVLGVLLLVGLSFVGLAHTDVHNARMATVVTEGHGGRVEVHSIEQPHVTYDSQVTYGYGQTNLNAPSWAKLILIAVMIALVSLLTSGEKARGVALRVLGVVALVIGGFAVLYLFRSMPSGGSMAMAPWHQHAEIAERPLPPVEVPPVAPVAPQVQPPVPEPNATVAVPEQVVPPAGTDAAPADQPTKPEQSPQDLPAESTHPAHEHVPEPATPVTDTPASADASATTAPASAETADHDHAAESKVAETSRAQRPGWVDQDARRIGADYFTHASSGLFTTLEEAERSLNPKARQVIDDYAGIYLGEEASGRIPIDESLIRRLSRERYEEHRNVTVGQKTHQMVQIHQQLVIDEPARHELKARWENVIRTGRLWYLGVGALLVVALVGTLFSYLKLDLMTGGSYRGRLQLAAAAAILVAAAAALIVS